MLVKTRLLPLAVLLVLGVSACGGGSASTPSGLSCKSLSPLLDGPNSSTSCSGRCSVEQFQSVSDGSFGSAAVFRFENNASGSVAVSANARGGGMFAAGTQLGVIWSATASSQSGVLYQLNTYRSGVMQDSFALGGNGDGTSAREELHSTRTTTLPYDMVEFRYLRASGTTTGTASVYELCAD